MPPKPRQQGPRKRTDSGSPVSRNVAMLLGGGVLAGVVAVVLVLALGGGDDSGTQAATGGSSARSALEAAGCTLEIVPSLKGADHSVTDPDGTSPTWNTFPPTSGPHNAETVNYGLFDSPVQQALLLHNLEHGAIAIQYGNKVPAATIDEIRAFYDDHQRGTIVAPLPRLGKRIALTAWNEDASREEGQGLLATCTAFDQDAFSAFFEEHQFKGPERFPADSMLPGSQ